MRNKKKKTILIIVILVVILIAGFLVYYFFFNNNGGNGIIPTLGGNKEVDTKNGIYINRVNLNKTVSVYDGCTVSSIDDIIVVLNDKYIRYTGTCMYMNETEMLDNNLSFDKDSDGKYIINLDKKKFVKDDNISSIILGNGIVRKLIRLNYNYIDFVVKNTENNGKYFNFTSSVTGFGFQTSFSFKSQSFGDGYDVSIGPYQASFRTLDDFPKIIAYNGLLLIIETKEVNDKKISSLYLYDSTTKLYDFNENLPLTINGITLDKNWNINFRYEASSKRFYVLFSKYKEFCSNDPDEESFYEFVLDYDYKVKKFKTPAFYKKGKGNNTCDYIKRYYVEG